MNDQPVISVGHVNVRSSPVWSPPAAALEPHVYQTGLALGRQLTWSDLTELLADEGRWSAGLN
ncbi:hypothetical protein [Micromonospora gifhornensis]|uniref:hypothetical protein n=1 Tax=Micromonospora gifhornensis TaxID=84594 RepID=UPI0019536563|nr:hypothetical protein [Micromonospora gifhornensis]